MSNTSKYFDQRARETFQSTVLKGFLKGKSLSEVERMEKEGLSERKKKLESIKRNNDDFFIIHHSVNIVAAWLSALSAHLVQEFVETRTDDIRQEQTVALSFFSRMANELWAIIELVEFGFDLQARALTRSYLEHCDVLICCIRDRELTNEYVNAVDPTAANHFWHKYISKNKAKAKVAGFVASVIGVEKTTIVDTLREDADFAGSHLLHPTITAGFAAAFGNNDEDYRSYPIFPEPIAASSSVFRNIVIHHLWLSFAMDGLPFESGGEWEALFRGKKTKGNAEMIHLQLLHSELFQFLLEHEILMMPDDEVGHVD